MEIRYFWQGYPRVKGETRVFWPLLRIPWVEIVVAEYSASWRVRGKVCEVAGSPLQSIYTIAQVTATRGDRPGNSRWGTVPKFGNGCHVNIKVRFAHFPVFFESTRGEKSYITADSDE